ncbi:hypothetical protein Tco_1223757, partial [Tanacetum coccineum]
QADQAGTQSQPSSSTVPPPPTSQPAPIESTTIPPTPVTEPTSEPSSSSTAPEHDTMEHPFEKPLPEHQQEKVVKSRRVVLTDLEDEATKNSSKQGRNLQKDESKVFETPKQGKSSGETYISPQGLEAAETLAEVLSQIKTKRRNVKTGVRRRLNDEDVSTGFENVSTGLEAAETLAEALSQIKTKSRNVKTGVRRRLDVEDVSTGFKDVSTGFTYIKSTSEKVSSGGEHVSASQREGKAVLEET